MSYQGSQQCTVEVHASIADCFTAIVDFEAYPKWSSAVRRAKVVERDRNGVGRLVDFTIDMRIRNVRYVLRYSYKKPSLLTWESVEGDVEKIEGAYRLRKLAADRTEATCEQAVTLGFWVPGPIRSLAERSALRQSVTEFKNEVERRFTAGSDSGRAARAKRG